MNDYSYESVYEAATKELMNEFCRGLEILDIDIIRKRLVSTYLSCGNNQRDFYTVIAMFNSLINTKTSAD
jgi:hypothetical protein